MNQRLSPPGTEAAPTERRVLLVGNPNVGKSALFNALTGLHATVSNYPGTTVEISRGFLIGDGSIEVIDSPGVNSLLPLSEDERVTFDLVANGREDPATVVVQVADAKDLRRSLLLTLELGQLHVRTVLILNMSDEAEARGIRVDTEGLAEALGIPVRRTVATRREGVGALGAALGKARVPSNHLPLSDDFAPAIAAMLAGRAPLPDPEAPPPSVARYHEAMLAHAARLAARFTSVAPRSARPTASSRGAAFSRRLGRLAVHPAWGWPMLLVVLFAVYEVVGVLGAGVLVDLLEDSLFGKYLNPLAKAALGYVPSPFLQDLFVGEYGVLTMGMTYGLAIVLPIVATFFLVFGALEDSGYLPRLAVMSDRTLRVMGLNGKAVLPMVLGLGCDTMATMTTRILSTRKERVLATLLLALGVPCSAQLGVILAMLASVPLSAGLVWFGTMAGVMVAVGWLGSRLLPGRRGDFVVELPPLRMPQLGNVLAKTAARVEWYLKEALPLFALGTLLLFALDRLHLLGAINRAGRPIVTGILGLPPEASEAFLIGFLRRDYAATRLFAMGRDQGLDTVQLVTAMVTITLFIPCVANVFIIARERGARTALAMAAFIFPFAFAVGGLVRLAMRAAGFWETP